MTKMTPAQVLERRRELLLNQDTDGFVDLFAPDGAIELPFSGPDLPARLDGQQAIRDFSDRAAASPRGSTIFRRSRFITPATPRS